MDFGEREVERGGGGGDRARGVQDELPLAVREQDAHGDVGAEECDEDDDGEGLEDPGDFYERDHVWRLVAALGIVAGGETGGFWVGAGDGILRHGSGAGCCGVGLRISRRGVG